LSTKNNYQFIKHEQLAQGLSAITFCRPEKRNALNDQMVDEIGDVLQTLRLDTTARVVILRGEGPSFCSGMDISFQKEQAQSVAPDATQIMFKELEIQFYGPMPRVLKLLWDSPIVSIAQVQGYAIESGMGMALTCDLVYASEDAKFFWRPVGGAGMLWHLYPWTIGLRKTKELLFEGNFVTGKEAEELGMINKCLPLESLPAEVEKHARRIAEKPREFLYLDKMSVNNAFETMGLDSSCRTSAVGHILSHLTTPSTDLRQKIMKGSVHEVREAMDKRASPFVRDIDIPKDNKDSGGK
jgi:enoyl-CoA hydratase